MYYYIIMPCGCAWYNPVCLSKCAYNAVAHTSVGRAIGGAVTKIGKGVGSVVKKVGKAVNIVASPLVKAIEYVGEKTGLDKPIKAVVGAVSSGVRAVGSAIENSGVVGQALADIYNVTKVVNPYAKALDMGLAGADVVEGKMGVGTAITGAVIGKKLKALRGGQRMMNVASTAKSAQYVKSRHSN
jgi:hypothetical protein